MSPAATPCALHAPCTCATLHTSNAPQRRHLSAPTPQYRRSLVPPCHRSPDLSYLNAYARAHAPRHLRATPVPQEPCASAHQRYKRRPGPSLPRRLQATARRNPHAPQCLYGATPPPCDSTSAPSGVHAASSHCTVAATVPFVALGPTHRDTRAHWRLRALAHLRCGELTPCPWFAPSTMRGSAWASPPAVPNPAVPA